MTNPDSNELLLAKHFALFVYPFLRCRPTRDSAPQIPQSSTRWIPWLQRLNAEEFTLIQESSFFFLPHVRELFFPEFAGETPTKSAHWLNVMKAVAGRKHDTPSQNNSIHRFTLSESHLASLSKLTLVPANTQDPRLEEREAGVAFRIPWIDVVLFPEGLGALVIKLAIDGDRPSVTEISSLLHRLRLVLPPYVGCALPLLKAREEDSGFHMSDLVDYLLADLTSPKGARPELAQDVCAFTRSSSERWSSSEFAQTYGDAFHVYLYACLAETNPGVDSDPEGSLTCFSDVKDQALYQLATCTDPLLPEYRPDPLYVARLFADHSFKAWSNWNALLLNDNAAFLGRHESPFTIGPLAHNVESDYFHIFLLTVFQKTRISLMFDELVRRTTYLRRNLKEARHLWEAFLMFRNRYWFEEISHRRQGNELFSLFKKAMNVPLIHDAMQAKISELQEYYENRFQRQTDRFLGFLAFIGLPATVLVTLFAAALVKEATWPEFLKIAAAAYVLMGGLWLIWRART